MEVIDDFYEDGTYGFDKKGAKEFLYYDGLICHNISNQGGTHSHAMKALMKANDTNDFKSGDVIEIYGKHYKIEGDINKINEFTNKSEQDVILGRHWSVPSERAKGKKLIGFWISDPKSDTTVKAIREMRQNSDNYKDIGKLLNIDYRDYYIHIASIYNDISLYFDFKQFKSIIN